MAKVNENYYPLIAAGVSALAKGATAASQRRAAKKLKESNYVPEELILNRDLAKMQAFGRQAPGQAKTEENIRRAQANTLSTIQRTAGGDTAKLASASIASQIATQDAFDRNQVRGQEFAEGAFGRIHGSNLAIARQKAQNRAEFNEAKIALLAASDQNYMKGFNDLMNGAMATAYLSDSKKNPTKYSSQGNLDSKAGGSWDPGSWETYNQIKNPWNN